MADNKEPMWRNAFIDRLCELAEEHREMAQKQPEPREIDALIAEKLFGWQWFLDPDQRAKALYPPADGEWERTNFNRRSRLIKPGEHFPPFSDWDRLGGLRDKEGRFIRFGVPRFTTNMADAWLIVAEMAKRGKNFELFAYSYQQTYATFSDMDEAAEGNGEHATETAICMAALKELE